MSSPMQMRPAARPNDHSWWRRAAAWVCFVVFALAAPSPLWALDTQRALTQCLHRIWQLQQGLPRATIFAIHQTSNGYLWLGTQDGLARFDGVRFTPAPDTDEISLSNIWVQDLAEDPQHNLWIGTGGQGLVRLNEGIAQRYSTKDGLPSDDVRCVAYTTSGLWIGTSNGVAHLGDSIVSYDVADGLSTSDVWALCEELGGKIYFGGDGNALSVWDGRAFSTLKLTSIPERSTIRALLAAPDGSVWVGTSAGLVRLDDQGKERLFTTGDGLAHDSILSLANGADGCVWIGSKEGFSRYSKEKFESFRSEDGLSQSSACSLMEDSEGSLWVGTKHGLNQFLDRRAVLFTVREGLPSNDTGPLLQDSKGIIWVGTLGAGISSFDGKRFVTLTTSDGLPSNMVYALAEGNDGDLWVGTDKGLARLRNGKVDATFDRNDGLPSEFILCLLSDRQQGLWVGTTQGVAELRAGRFEPPKGDPDAQSIPIHSLAELSDKTLLMAGGNGRLFRYSDGELRAFRPEGLNPTNIDSLHVDPEGMVWGGAEENGLYLYDGKKTLHFTTKDGLYDDEIFAIIADDEDRLWMSCGRGVFFVSRSELRNFRPNSGERLNCSPFTPTDSSRTIECKGGVSPAMWSMQDGSIWFSTIRGLIVIDAKKINRPLPASPVTVEEVLVNGENFPPNKLKKLPPGGTNMEFRYSALSFIAPTRIVFRYKLEGFDNDWIDAGTRREAYYTNLPPGTYQFRVMARNFLGEYQESASMPPFTILPRFYQRAWFWPGCAAVLGLLGWAGYRMRVRRIKDQMRAVVSERSRIARELHDTLMQGFSGVTMQMQALSTRLPSSDERDNLQDIIRDAGVCLRDARRSVAGLRHEPEGQSGLATALAQAARQLTETHDIRLKLRVQRSLPELPLDVEYNLLRIAQEAIANAVKHSGAESIEVTLDRMPGHISLVVQDDGAGFVTSNGNGAPLGHFGLIGMRERAGQIGAEWNLESVPGHGTRVNVTMPTTRSDRVAAESLKPVQER